MTLALLRLLAEKPNRHPNRSVRDVVRAWRPAGAPDLPEEAFDMASLLRIAIIRSKPDHRVRAMSDSQWLSTRDRWAADIDKLLRVDSVSSARVENVLYWLPTDDFWPSNIGSGAKLRQQFDKLEAAMRRGSGPRHEKKRKKPPDMPPPMKPR